VEPYLVAWFIARLRDHHPRARARAARRLGELRDRRAVEPLLAALDDVSLTVRWEAVRALGQLADARPLPALREKARPWSGEDEPVRDRAARAVQQIEAALAKVTGRELALAEESEGHEGRPECALSWAEGTPLEPGYTGRELEELG